MNKFLRKLCLFTLFSFAIFFSQANAQSVRNLSSEERRFFEEAILLIKKTKKLDASRLTHYRRINDSYEKIQEALLCLQTGQPAAKAQTLLNASLKAYPSNFLAALFLGILLEEEGEFEAAREYYTVFLTKSPFPSPFEEKWLAPSEIHSLQELLKQRFARLGWKIPKTKIPFAYRIRLGLNRLQVFPEESLLGVTLSAIVLIGLALLLFYSLLTRYETNRFSSPAMRLLLRSYSLCVFAYCLWMTHLYLGLGPFWRKSLVNEISSVLWIGFVLIVCLQLAEAGWRRNQLNKDPDYRPCPFCRKTILKLATECPTCRKKV